MARSRVTSGSMSPLPRAEQPGIALGARLLLDLVDAAVLELLPAAAGAGVVPSHPGVIDPLLPRQDFFQSLQDHLSSGAARCAGGAPAPRRTRSSRRRAVPARFPGPPRRSGRDEASGRARCRARCIL